MDAMYGVEQSRSAVSRSCDTSKSDLSGKKDLNYCLDFVLKLRVLYMCTTVRSFESCLLLLYYSRI